MKNTLRFNPPRSWYGGGLLNPYIVGLNLLTYDLAGMLQGRGFELKMLEIGSYCGESTMLLGASGIFDEIHCIEPFEGHEKANTLFDRDWSEVKREFWTNTRYFKDKVHLYQDYSYNIVDSFADESFDFIYIDASHEYEDITQNIENYLPKVKKGGVIGGHDYIEEFPGVIRAVDELLGTPQMLYQDTSWLVRKN
jgi:predicted O-methyltransferase YrrM|tara:strand:+ start:2346 stop:2930 length:585 start_codon:yes stop_codon:yes gene_type:complete